MPNHNVIINIPGFSIKKISGYNPIIYDAVFHRKARCHHCGSKKLRKKDKFIRLVNHETIGMRLTKVRFTSYKYKCTSCLKYFHQRFPGIMPYQRSSEPLKQQIYKGNKEGVSNQDLAARFKISTATIERWYHKSCVKYHQELLSRYDHCPRVLGIDEHFFNKRSGFATTFCDLEKHRIHDVVLGRSSDSLYDYLQSLGGREKVQMICIDLSKNYRQIARNYFPNAKIVADRFHVIRLVNQQFMKLIVKLHADVRYNRSGLLLMMRKHHCNLTEKQLTKLKQILQEDPVLSNIYHFKQDLNSLLLKKHHTKKRARKLAALFLSYIKILKESNFKELESLGKTLEEWQVEIARMWRYTRNNGITEGFHRKMKLIQRRAYGFKSFENYRLRVKLLCM